MNDTNPVRVIIADDQAIVRSGLGAFVMAYEQLQLVGEARDGEEAIELCELLKPDVVLMDLKMPRMDGIAATRVIRQRWPNIQVLVLTSFKEKEKVQGALEAGATGYLLKDLSASDLAEAILQVHQGRRLISPQASEAIIRVERMSRLEEDVHSAGSQPSLLGELLKAHLPAIFPNYQIQVRLFPDQDLLTYPSPLPKPITDSVWRWLGAADAPSVFSHGETYPWGGVHPHGSELILAPVISPYTNRASGGIALISKEEGQDTDEVLSLVNHLGRIISQTLPQAQERSNQQVQQRASQELEMAWRIQAGILPAGAPTVRGWDMAAKLEPAHETSGDFFDFIPLANDKWGIVIADVTDKGLGAAVFMALCSTLIRTYAARYPTLPAITMSSVNERILSDTRGSLFVTAFYGILEPDIGRLRYVNAGHNPPFLLSSLKSKRVDRLTRTGIPLGISTDATWQQKVVKFSPGDLLVLFTDGITEARDRHGSFFGDQRLLDVLRANLGRAAEEIQQAVLDEVQRFSGNAPREDDIAIIIMARKN
jgi:serine phosphatase RsbU (regulator of sigma subunit)/DNA-binding NarL/FixJ family response regulator